MMKTNTAVIIGFKVEYYVFGSTKSVMGIS